MTTPLFIFDIAQAWPETRAMAKRNLGSSAECPDGIAAVTMAVAHMLSGRPLNTDVRSAYEKIVAYLQLMNVPEDRVQAWAKSLLMDPNETVPNLDCIPTKNLAMGFTYHPFQREGAGWAAHRRGSLLAYGCGVGKALLTTELVLTPIGWRQIGTLQVGDFVVGSDGHPTEVLGVYPQGIRDIAKVTTVDGASLVCDWDHLWCVEDARKQGAKVVLSTADMLAAELTYGPDDRKRWYLPLVAPVQYADSPLSIDPYLLGILLGTAGPIDQGTPDAASFPSRSMLRHTFQRRGIQTATSSNRRTYTAHVPGIRHSLSQLGLLDSKAHSKSIPVMYMHSAEAARRALLRGLLDAGGTKSAGGVIQFTSLSPAIASAVCELVESLGGIAARSTKDTPAHLLGGPGAYRPTEHRLKIALPDAAQPLLGEWAWGRRRMPRRNIASIEPAGRAACVCIKVAAPDSLFVANHHMLTHNTGTATAAAVGAVRLGNASNERCIIMCPVNAQAVWEKARADLDAVFKKVVIYSMDSAHHFANLDPGPGGALIVDEAHKAKGEEARRSKAMRAMRRCFDWATCLTGSLLESGPEGLLALHDIACPGLSRFMCAMDFGKNFDCIAVTQIGRGTRRKLVIPGAKSAAFMVPYLARSTRSLSFESPEVAAVVHMEAHRDFVEDTWARPDWMGLDDPSILWCPDTGWQTYMGAMAVCMMHDDRDDMLAFAAKHGHQVALTTGGVAGSAAPAHHEVAWQALQAQFVTWGTDPFFPIDEAKEARRMARLGGLATFPRIMHAVLREGRFARTIRQEKDPAIGSTYRWYYAPGHSRLNPGEGPKLHWARHWLEHNPKEQLVLGAGGKATVGACKALLDDLGVSYRVIEGGVSAEDRGTFCDEFQAGKARVMLLQQVAGSESVTLTAAATSVLLDHDLKATAYTQYRHRTYRQGQKRESEHYDLVFGPRQEALLALIQRGRSFDQSTRDQLEREARATGAQFG